MRDSIEIATRAADAASRSADAATASSESANKTAQLATREENLKKELAELEANREELAGAVDESVRGRYERLVKHKGENVVVGIQHGVCGGFGNIADITAQRRRRVYADAIQDFGGLSHSRAN